MAGVSSCWFRSKPQLHAVPSLSIMNERIDALPHEKLLDCFYHPEANRGGIESILAESFAMRKK